MSELEIGKQRSGGVSVVQETVEDLLKELAQRRELEGAWDPVELMSGKSGETRGAVLDWLVRGGYLEGVGSAWRLTERGVERAIELLRAHRLMETYLARKRGRPSGVLHTEADREEHYLTAEKANELADLLNRPRFDPHGDPIPERASDLQPMDQVPLTSIEAGTAILVAHIEDEPAEDFERLMELGFAPELPLKVIRTEADAVEVVLAGERIILTERLAKHIEVCPLPEGDSYCEELRRLSRLKPGEAGVVEFITAACVGPERRRLQDFGMVPGSVVECEFASPFGSPMAYTVRGTVLGLRESQARNILIRRQS